MDKRRDKTTEIPAATLAELLASRKRLAPRQDTLDLGAGPLDQRPVVDTDEQYMLRAAPKTPIPREELEAMLGPHLEPFTPARRLAFLQAFEVRSYARAVSALDEDVKRQPKNISMATEARALRQLALSRLEGEVGGLHVAPRVAKPLSTVAAPSDLESMLRMIDGQAPFERILRSAKIDRLRGLDFLAGLARSGHIDLPVTTTAEPEPLSLPPMSARSQTRPKASSSAPPPSQEPLELQAHEPFASPIEKSPFEAEPAMFPATLPPPMRAPFSDPAPVIERPSSPEPPSSVRAATRMVSARPQKRSEGPQPAILIAAGALVMVLVVVGVVALRRAGSDAKPGAAALVTQQAPAVGDPTQRSTVATAVDQPTASKPASPTLESVRVRIKAEPKYARVTVDGVLLTGSPIEVELAKNTKEHVLKVESTGFKPHSATFTAEENASFVIALERLPPKH